MIAVDRSIAFLGGGDAQPASIEMPIAAILIFIAPNYRGRCHSAQRKRSTSLASLLRDPRRNAAYDFCFEAVESVIGERFTGIALIVSAAECHQLFAG